MIKLYIFDADGTLCSRDTGELLPNTLERIKALPKGSHIAIATNQGGVGLRHWMEVDGFGEPEKFPTAFEVFDMYSKVAEQIGCAAENTFYSFAYQSKKTGKWSPTPDGAESHPFWRKDWRKPDAGMINTAVIASGVADKSSVVFVGDSKEGKEAAEKAEVRFIYANDFFGRA